MSTFIRTLVAGIIIHAVAATSLAAPVVSFNKSSVRAHVGDTITIDLLMSGFPLSEGGGVTLKYDASMIHGELR